ncbi:YciI family protein [Lutibacter sp.]|uniref:YciI family protein n=1 Tax=Lutibacter sp. TaxID=1925666 RepID=UPI0034A04220
MKTFFYFLLLSTSLFSCTNSGNTNSKEISSESNKFDAELAKKLNADNYGMKTYVMAFLKRGPNRSQDSITAANLQRSHLENITKLANAGKLVLAGPFLDTGDLRGIYIFDVATIEEAKKLTETDPAIQQGSLVMELKLWYGSAALLQINEIHKKIAKIEI